MIPAPDPRAAAPLPGAVRLGARDLISLGCAGLRARPLRAALSTLGIAVGITTLVLVVGVSRSSGAGLNAQLDALGANLLLAQGQAQGNRPTRFVSAAQAMTSRIAPVTAAAELAALPEAVRRSPRLPAGEETGLNAYAATPALPGVLHTGLLAGGFLTRRTARMRAVVLGRAAAANLGIDARALPARPQISIGRASFTVVGILAAMPVTTDLDYGVFIGWSAARAAFAFAGHATSVYVRVDPSQLGPVGAVLGPTLLPPAPGLVSVTQPSTALAAKRAVGTSASSLVLGLVAIALVVGGIGIANTMYLSVFERRREIGLRRALGASERQIRAQFLIEAVVLALAGSLTGALLGACGTAGYALYDRLPVVIAPTSVAAGIAGGVAIGVLAGAWPADRAARLMPAEALAST